MPNILVLAPKIASDYKSGNLIGPYMTAAWWGNTGRGGGLYFSLSQKNDAQAYNIGSLHYLP